MVKSFQFSDVFISEHNANNIHVTGILNLKTPSSKATRLRYKTVKYKSDSNLNKIFV